MSNVFLSFLGTSDYKTCNYHYGNKIRKTVVFAQEAILNFFCMHFKENDKILIFLTEKAKEKNWEKNSKGIGLKETIENLELPAQLIPVSIPEGNSEEEIWKIFEIVYEHLEPEDEVILDITHSFRSIPMLTMVLLNYTRFLKDIKIKGIYYGAYEARIGEDAPVFDLTSFERLQRWSIAAENFVNHGITDAIANLVYPQVNPLLKESMGSNESAKAESYFAKLLNRVGSYFSTVRGKRIYMGREINRLKQNLNQVKGGELIIKPLRPLLDKVRQKIEAFKPESIDNMIEAVKWCINHDLIQQGITMLQETIISYILEENGLEWYAKDRATSEKKKKVKRLREDLSQAIHLYGKNGDRNDWDYEFKIHSKIIKKVIESESFQRLFKTNEKLRDLRNDINHAGLIDDFEPGNFKDKLKSSFEEIKKIILYGG